MSEMSPNALQIAYLTASYKMPQLSVSANCFKTESNKVLATCWPQAPTFFP